jgi:peptidoglycan/LPS O-acetylase OafA/YrhL
MSQTSDSRVSPAGGRLASIDALRGIAALAVLAMHAVSPKDWQEVGSGFLMSFKAVLDYGHLGVPLFFVLSGFCIHLRWARLRALALYESKDASNSPLPSVDFLPFWKRRMRRLYPAYFVMLCLSMALLWVRYRMGNTGQYEYAGPWQQEMVKDFFAHVFMLHGLFHEYDSNGGNTVYWTLAREEYLYLMYFPLMWWRRTRGVAFALLIVLILSIAVPWGAQLLVQALGNNPKAEPWKSWLFPINPRISALALWSQWTLGVVAVENYYGLIRLPVWCRCGWLVPLWAGAAIIAEKYAMALMPLLWGMTFFTLVNFCVTNEKSGLWRDNLVMRFLEKVGVFSYSLYLVHMPFLSVVQGIEAILVKRQIIPQTLSQTLPYQITVWALLIISSIAAGWVFFMLVERHFLSAPRTPKEQGGVSGLATASVLPQNDLPELPEPASPASPASQSQREIRRERI